MGFWSFVRGPVKVERVSRVVTAKIGDALVRGRLTLHFQAMQTQHGADGAAEYAGSMMECILAALPSPDAAMGGEARLHSELCSRLPSGFPKLRTVELAGLHVVGIPTSSARGTPSSGISAGGGRTSSATRRIPGALERAIALGPQGLRPASAPRWDAPDVAPGARAPLSGAPVPPPSPSAPGASSAGPVRRNDTPEESLATARAQPSLTPPPGRSASPAPGHGPILGAVQDAPPRPLVARRASGVSRRDDAVTASRGGGAAALGARLAEPARDAATRLLVAALRVGRAARRGSPQRELASLLPSSEACLAGAAEELASELAGHRAAFGGPAFTALEREASVAATFLVYSALQQAGTPVRTTFEAIEVLCAAAFPEVRVVAELGRYLHALEPSLDAEIARGLASVLDPAMDATPLREAVGPLVARIEQGLASSLSSAPDGVARSTG